MSDEIKNVWDVALAVLAMVGAGIAFGFGLYQWRKGQNWQRERAPGDWVLLDELRR